MGNLFALFQAIWNNYFNPNAWIGLQSVNVIAWLKMFNLDYNNSKTLATNIFSYNAVAVGQTIVNLTPAGTQNPDSEHFMIQAIQFYDGANATLNATDWALGISDALGKQGLLTITNAGSIELKNFPLRKLIPATGDSGSGMFLLPKAIMWKGQTELVISVSFPTAPATALYNIGIDIIGLKLI